MRNRGRFAVAALVAGFTWVPASTASAAVTGVYGPIKGDTGKPGQFHADVYTNSKHVVTRVSYIQAEWLDFECTGPDGQPYALDNWKYDFPAVRVRKAGDKYGFTTSNGSFDELSATVSRNGERLHGKIRVHTEYIDGSLAGSTCDAQTTFKAKSYYLY